jgi:hypothetical protein
MVLQFSLTGLWSSVYDGRMYKRKLTHEQIRELNRRFHFPPYEDVEVLMRDYDCSESYIFKHTGGATPERLRVTNARKPKKPKKQKSI